MSKFMRWGVCFLLFTGLLLPSTVQAQVRDIDFDWIASTLDTLLKGFAPGININLVNMDNDGNGIIDDVHGYNAIGDHSDPIDGHGHGTHCIGTACGPKEPFHPPRYGIAWGASILAGKVLDDNGGGADGGILAGIEWALAQGARVISMSLGAEITVDTPFSEVFEAVGQRALAGGALIVAAAGKVATGESRPDGHYTYLQRIAGLPVGASRAQGVIRGSRFYHADMGFTLAFPAGWNVINLPSKVMATTAQKDAVLSLYAMAPPQGMAPREFLARSLQGVPLSAAEPLEANGLSGYTAIAREVPLPWGNRGPARYAVLYYNNLAYVFMGATRLNSALSASDPLMLSSIKTFRRLKKNESAQAAPNGLRLMKATADTRIADLARKSPLPKNPAERLRLLNDLYPDKEPVPGQWLKIVE